MKNLIFRILLTAILGLSLMVAKADGFVEKDGFCFEIRAYGNVNPYAVLVNRRNIKYSGDIVIPSTVSFKGTEYTVTYIDWEVFKDCDGLTSVVLPEKLGGIGHKAFENCINLSSISLPGCVTGLAPAVFMGCSGLTSVTFEASDKYLELNSEGLGGFNGCDNLKEIVTSRYFDTGAHIGKYGWVYPYGFQNVTDIKIPAGAQVKDFIERNTLRSQIENLTIGKDAGDFPMTLIDYKSLKKLTLGDEIPRTCPEFTEEQFRSVELNVPESALEAYMAADGWKNFLYVTVSDLRDVTTPAGKTVTARYDLSGRPVAEDYYGVVIIRYSDGSVEKTIRR